jgi:uncharacterized membrane protein AbrB (regulator of aidB expression)
LAAIPFLGSKMGSKMASSTLKKNIKNLLKILVETIAFPEKTMRKSAPPKNRST